MVYEIISRILIVLVQAISIYQFILIIRVLLTWFPNLDMSNPILLNLCAITDPYLNFFRGIIPPLGGLDLSPILAFVVLNISQNLLVKVQFAFLNTSLVNNIIN